MTTIRALRQDRGWTQFELALKVGVRPQAVYLWEHGRRTPQVPQLRKLGGAGTICGIANLYPRLMRRLYDSSLDAKPGGELPLIESVIAALMRFPIFGALKSLQAELSGDESWRALRAPLLPLSAADARALDQAIAAAGIDPKRDGA